VDDNPENIDIRVSIHGGHYKVKAASNSQKALKKQQRILNLGIGVIDIFFGDNVLSFSL